MSQSSRRASPSHVVDPLNQREQVPGYLSETRLETIRLVNVLSEDELRGLISSFTIQQLRGWIHATLKNSSEKGLKRWRERLLACQGSPEGRDATDNILGLPTELCCKILKFVDLKSKWMSCCLVNRSWRRLVLLPDSWEVVEFPRDLWYSFAIGRKVKGNIGGSRTAQSYMLRWMPRWLQARSVQFLPDFSLDDRSGLEALHSYANQLPHLTELDLNAHLRLPFANHDHLVQERELDILVNSSVAPRLTSLSLFAGYLEGSSFAKLAVCTQLRRLSLTRCRLIPDLGLLTVLKACPDLEELLLTDAVQLTPATFANIVKFCPKLRSLTLTGCRALTAEALVEFSDSLAKGCPPLRRLELYKTHFFRGISPQNPFLSSCRQLEVFMIDAPILPEQWQLLMQHCHELRVLHVHGMLLTDQDLVLASRAPCAASLEDLYLEHSPLLTEEGLIALFKATPNLLRLKISDTLNLTDRVMYTLGQHCPRLRNLSLPGASLITDCGVLSLLFGVRLPPILEQMLDVLCYHRELAAYEAAGAAAAAAESAGVPEQQQQEQDQEEQPQPMDVLQSLSRNGVQQALQMLSSLSLAPTPGAAAHNGRGDAAAAGPHPQEPVAEANLDRPILGPRDRRRRSPRALYVDRLALGPNSDLLTAKRRSMFGFMLEAYSGAQDSPSSSEAASSATAGVQLSQPQRVAWPEVNASAGDFRTLAEHVIHGALSRLAEDRILPPSQLAEGPVISLDSVLLFDEFRDAFDAGSSDPEAFDQLKTLCRNLAVRALAPDQLVGLFQLQGAVENHPSYQQRYRSLGLMPATYHLAQEEVRDLFLRDLVQVRLQVASDGRVNTELRALPPPKTPSEVLSALAQPPPGAADGSGNAVDPDEELFASAGGPELLTSIAVSPDRRPRPRRSSMSGSGSDNELPVDEDAESPPAAVASPSSAVASGSDPTSRSGGSSSSGGGGSKTSHLDGDQTSILPLTNRQFVPKPDSEAERLWETGVRQRLARPQALAGGCRDLQLFVLSGSRLVSNFSAQLLGLGADLLRVAVIRGTSIDRVGVRWLTQARNLRCVACSSDSSRKYLRVCGISPRPTLTVDDLLRYGIELEEQNLDTSTHTP